MREEYCLSVESRCNDRKSTGLGDTELWIMFIHEARLYISLFQRDYVKAHWIINVGSLSLQRYLMSSFSKHIL